MKEAQKRTMGHVSIEVLEAIEAFALARPNSQVTQMRADMMQVIGPDSPAGAPEAIKRFKRLYEQASDIVFPATQAFLRVSHALGGYSNSHSLSAIDLETLRAIDQEAHRNPALKRLRNDLKSRLDKVATIDDVVAYSQVFEVYGEIVAYLLLRKFGTTTRLREKKGQPTPDFHCRPSDIKPFYVEVKTFDIVGGDARKRAMLYDGLDMKVQLEDQIRAGKSVASAQTIVAPYRKGNEADPECNETDSECDGVDSECGQAKRYSACSLIRVIDTLRDKSLQSFKQTQFNKGPTVGLAVLDRLPLLRGKFDLAPYYYSDFSDGGIASGVLWHMVYGRPGTPIFQLPEFAGAKSLEGHLDSFGLFVDEARPFPGPGLIVLVRERGSYRAFGLVNKSYSGVDDWSIDDTEAVLNKVCDHWNNQAGTHSWGISADISKKDQGSGSDT